ncbi:metallopeptidase family protein [Candidatus Poriferisodalis sp.]|uniref:metallopeptidase family protein n=1 Tax=Candidatus Poriferisodalis sp. TaxID=3101277 RepID=UPI003B010664
MLEMDEAAFADLVEQALEDIPDALRSLMDNVAIFVEDRGDDPDMLGVYEGIPLTERHDYGGLAMPDSIVIYRLPILEMCETPDDVVEEVLVTVVHEVAHHFGIDDDRLHELGWD